MNKQLITFDIEPNLERMWKLIGVEDEERENQIQNLYETLMKAYHGFVEQVSRSCEEFRSELFEAQEEFKRVQKAYDDDQVNLPIKPNLPYKDQIDITHSATERIQNLYKSRIQEFNYIHKELMELYDNLGIPNDERGDFIEVGESDLSEIRLESFKKRLDELLIEFKQRSSIIKSYYDHILDLKDQLDEPIPESVIQIFEQDLCDNESVQILSDTLNEFQRLKEERTNQVDSLNEKIAYYYDILCIDPSDQLQKSTDITAQNIENLENEVQFLKETSRKRFPIVIQELNKSITMLCDDMSIPLKMRPHYTGTNIEKQANFLKSELEKLKQRQIYCRPVIDLISEIEKQKEYLAPSSTFYNRSTSSRKYIEFERLRKNANEQIPILEKKLYQLLVEYRNKTGQDFYFNDTKIIDTLNPEKIVEEEKTTSLAASKKLLYQKMNDSLYSGSPFRKPAKTPTRGKTSKVSTYTLTPAQK